MTYLKLRKKVNVVKFRRLTPLFFPHLILLFLAFYKTYRYKSICCQIFKQRHYSFDNLTKFFLLPQNQQKHTLLGSSTPDDWHNSNSQTAERPAVRNYGPNCCESFSRVHSSQFLTKMSAPLFSTKMSVFSSPILSRKGISFVIIVVGHILIF